MQFCVYLFGLYLIKTHEMTIIDEYKTAKASLLSPFVSRYGVPAKGVGVSEGIGVGVG